MSEVNNPLNKISNAVKGSSVFDTEDAKKDFIAQMGVPWEKRTYRAAPWVFKCDHKVVKYDSRGFNIWRVC